MPEFSFYALDLRGQGSDPVASRRGVALQLEWQMRDIAAFVEALQREHREKPVFLMGESMGALLAAAYASGWGAGTKIPHAPVDGVVLSVPVVGLRKHVPAIVKKALRLMAGWLPKTKLSPNRFVSGKIPSPPITRDKAYQDSLREKPHHIKDFTLGFFAELGDLIDNSHVASQQLLHPTLVLAAGQDCFVKVEQIEAWFHRIPAPEKALKIYPEAYHLLWHDWDRDQVMGDIRAWLTERC